MKNWILSIVALFSSLSGESVTGLVRRRGKAAQFWNITLPDQDLIQDGLDGRSQSSRGGRSFPLVLDNTEVYPFPPGTIFSVSCKQNSLSVLLGVLHYVLSVSTNPGSWFLSCPVSLLSNIHLISPALLWDCNQSVRLQRGLLTEYAPWFPCDLRNTLPGFEMIISTRKLKPTVQIRTKVFEPSQPQGLMYMRNWRGW